MKPVTAQPGTPVAAASPGAVTLEEVFELLPAGVIALDRERRVRFVSPSGARALGLEQGDLETADDLASLVGEEAVAEAMKAAAEDGQERRMAVFFEDKKGRVSELGLSVVPQSEEAAEAGSELGALIIFRLLEDGRSLDQRMREIEHLAAVGHLAAGFAHEVRNPIAAIQGLAECLVEELPSGTPQIEYGQRILGLVDRIERLVRSCLDLGGAPIAVSSPVEAEALIEAAVRHTESADRVRVDIEPATLQVMADAAQTAGCLHALIANALEACDPPAEVTVRVRPGLPDRQRVVFEVIDHGEGIPARLLGRVFEPFFTTKPASAGLGLAVARLVAARNRGSLEVRSRRGETIFALTLPAVEDLAEGAP